MSPARPRAFDCAVCCKRIRPRRLHLIVGSSVVCMGCAGTSSAHDLAGCPIGWHDGWDHGRPCSDRRTADLVIARGACA